MLTLRWPQTTLLIGPVVHPLGNAVRLQMFIDHICANPAFFVQEALHLRTGTGACLSTAARAGVARVEPSEHLLQPARNSVRHAVVDHEVAVGLLSSFEGSIRTVERSLHRPAWARRIERSFNSAVFCSLVRERGNATSQLRNATPFRRRRRSAVFQKSVTSTPSGRLAEHVATRSAGRSQPNEPRRVM